MVKSIRPLTGESETIGWGGVKGGRVYRGVNLVNLTFFD